MLDGPVGVFQPNSLRNQPTFIDTETVQTQDRQAHWFTVFKIGGHWTVRI